VNAWLRLSLFLLSGLCAGGRHAPASAEDCVAAATDAERHYGIPSGLLAAIGAVESGRPDKASGSIRPWPWTIDAAGASQFLPSLPAAVAALSTLEHQGVQRIDVGCFQVDLTYHPDAFASVQEAFDPAANASYAAQFLTSLYRRLGSWQAAVMNYHSAWPDIGSLYEQRVVSRWRDRGMGLPGFGLTISAPADTPPDAIQPEVIVLSRSLSPLPRIITPVIAP
jgi:hypothetical protein